MRTLLAAAAITAACATPAAAQEAAPAAPRLVESFTILAELEAAVEVGETVRGVRRFIPITGGQVTGEAINGTVRGGAWDWQLDRPDGCLDLEADYFIETDDGALINVVNRATVCRPGEGEAMSPVYTRPVFEPPRGDYEWLGRGAFIGRLSVVTDHSVPAVRITVYRVE